MIERLIEAKAQLESQIRQIEKAIKFFEEHPEMEHILTAYQSVANTPVIRGY